jgi:hypothetical protein
VCWILISGEAHLVLNVMLLSGEAHLKERFLSGEAHLTLNAG